MIPSQRSGLSMASCTRHRRGARRLRPSASVHGLPNHNQTPHKHGWPACVQRHLHYLSEHPLTWVSRGTEDPLTLVSRSAPLQLHFPHQGRLCRGCSQLAQQIGFQRESTKVLPQRQHPLAPKIGPSSFFYVASPTQSSKKAAMSAMHGSTRSAAWDDCRFPSPPTHLSGGNLMQRSKLQSDNSTIVTSNTCLGPTVCVITFASTPRQWQRDVGLPSQSGSSDITVSSWTRNLRGPRSTRSE